jgi:cytochrome c biogenesis protein CcdA
MLRLLGVVISIGLADSLNPGTVGPALLLAGGKNPRRSVFEFTFATFATFVIGGLILTLGPGHAILSIVPHPDATTRYILETSAGAAMLVVAIVLWRRRHRLRNRRERSSEQPGRARIAARNPAIMGATLAVVELPTAFPYFAAIAAIVGSGLGLTSQILLVVIYNVCFVLPLLGIILMLTLLGERTVQILGRVRRYLQENWPVVAAVAALLAGAFVITLGVTGLTARAPGRVGRFSRKLRRLISH